MIKVENAKGVPANYLMHLEKQIKELAPKIIGEVMVFELVQRVQVIDNIIFNFLSTLKTYAFLFRTFFPCIINLSMHLFMKK